MSDSRPSLCITCGLDAGPSPRLNRLEDGSACPACRERMLDVLPPLFPGFGHLIERTQPRRARTKSGQRGPRSVANTPKKPRGGRRPDVQ